MLVFGFKTLISHRGAWPVNTACYTALRISKYKNGEDVHGAKNYCQVKTEEKQLIGEEVDWLKAEKNQLIHNPLPTNPFLLNSIV